MATFLRILKAISYGMLAAVTFAGLAMTLPFSLGFCADTGGGQIACDSAFWSGLFEQGATMMLMAVYAIVPLVLAGLGIIFLVRDIFWNKTPAAASDGER